MKITIILDAPNWTEENFNAFQDYISEEVFQMNMFSDDNVAITAIVKE